MDSRKYRINEDLTINSPTEGKIVVRVLVVLENISLESKFQYCYGVDSTSTEHVYKFLDLILTKNWKLVEKDYGVDLSTKLGWVMECDICDNGLALIEHQIRKEIGL